MVRSLASIVARTLCGFGNPRHSRFGNLRYDFMAFYGEPLASLSSLWLRLKHPHNCGRGKRHAHFP